MYVAAGTRVKLICRRRSYLKRVLPTFYNDIMSGGTGSSLSFASNIKMVFWWELARR